MEEYSLKKFLRSPFPVKILPYLLLGFALLGFLDASYLTIQHYQHSIPPCTIGGCEAVLTSSFATVFGIPLSLIGVGFYGCILILTGIYLTVISSETRNLKDNEISHFVRDDKKRSSRFARTITTTLFILCSLGFLVGLVLIGIQAFILHSWCYYCLFSELIDFLLFDASWWLYNSGK